MNSIKVLDKPGLNVTEDTVKIIDRLQNVSPFDEVQSLMNIVNGVVADKSFYVDGFYSMGTSIINKMSGQKVFNYTFKRKDVAKIMSSKTKIGKNNKIDIDPTLLFQRLLVIANASTVSPNDVFSYELESYPPAIFETPILLRKADKSKIIEAIRNHIKQQETQSNLENGSAGQCDINYVLDGGSLLHRICWEKDCSFQDIANAYVKLVTYYGPDIIVFDGYMSGPSTKDNAHLSRNAKGESKQVNFTSEMKFHCTKSSFLANVHNKSKMIQLTGLDLKNADVL